MGFRVDGNSLPDLTVFRPLDIERYAKRLALEAAWRGARRGERAAVGCSWCWTISN